MELKDVSIQVMQGATKHFELFGVQGYLPFAHRLATFQKQIEGILPPLD
ncbi:hypothetical protein OROMI_003204 [Orobanche minor]